MNKRISKLWIGAPAILLVGLTATANGAATRDSEPVAKAEAKTMSFQRLANKLEIPKR